MSFWNVVLFFLPTLCLWFADNGDAAAGGPAGDEDGDGRTDDATGDESPNGGDVTEPFIAFATEDDYQKAIDARLKERLERERRKAERAARRAAEDAEARALEEQQKFQELAEKRAEKIAKLEPQVTDLETRLETAEAQSARYLQALEAHLAAQKDGLPEHILALLGKLDPVEQLQYIADNGPALAAKQTNGIPASPKPGDGRGLSEAEKEAARQQASRQYRSQF